MTYLSNFIFSILLFSAIFFFRRNILYVKRNIHIGKSVDRSDQSSRRWSNMILIALGQSKMIDRPISGLLHIVVYVGFLIINIELLEIILDGLFGTHRVFAPYFGSAYDILIASFEVFVPSSSCLLAIASESS